MITLRNLRLMNESMILYLKKLGKSTKRNEIIRNILKYNNCFLKMKEEDAKDMLKSIGVEEDRLDLVYSEIINC